MYICRVQSRWGLIRTVNCLWFSWDLCYAFVRYICFFHLCSVLLFFNFCFGQFMRVGQGSSAESQGYFNVWLKLSAWKLVYQNLTWMMEYFSSASQTFFVVLLEVHFITSGFYGVGKFKFHSLFYSSMYILFCDLNAFY